MAGYVKMWTTLRNNTEFLSLSMAQRGMYMQLILACKGQRDDGTVCYRNVTALGSDCGCERHTAGKTLGILTEKSLCTYTQNDASVLTITIPNYKHWQEIGVDQVREKSRKIPAKIPPLRPDQTRPEQTRAIIAGKPLFEQLRNLYIEICKGFPEPTEISDWSPKRRGNVNARWKAHSDIDWWRTYFERIMASEFLKQGNESWSGADFGWIMLPSNMEKILEGRYDNKKKKVQLTSEKDYGPAGERPF